MDAATRERLALDALVTRLGKAARLLPALSPSNAFAERARLVGCIERGEAAVPAWELPRRRVDPGLLRDLADARRLAERSPAAASYLARLEEIELELRLLESLGRRREVRRLAARRFGTGRTRVTVGDRALPLERVAAAILDTVADEPEEAVLPADAAEGPSVARALRATIARIGLDAEVRVDARLAAGAAAGDRIILLARRRFGAREALRLTAHEVLGHLVAAANGRSQPLRLFEAGTARSFTDQEGLAIWLEERSGTLCGRRLRVLAARVVVADQMHGGATFTDAARAMQRDHGFDARDAVVLCERAFRGGGVARDVCYLHGWLRVRGAITAGEATVDELRAGRVGLDDLPVLRALEPEGLFRPAVYRPSLSRSLAATELDTSSVTSPPSVATSFTSPEAT